MEPILVTGGTGNLGRAVVRRLRSGKREIRALSRRRGPADTKPQDRHVVGDMVTGEGLASAVDGVATIVHCATTNGSGDITATRNLVDAVLRNGGTTHLVYVSIVGADTIPIPYYRNKLAAEQVIMDSGLPWSIQRVTQFHDLVAALFAWQRRLPATLALNRFRFQPIDTRDVALRLTDLATDTPVGMAPDIGGPQVRSMSELAKTYNHVHRRHRRVVSLGMPGKIGRGFAQGNNLVPDNEFGTISFEDFVNEHLQDSGR